MTKNELKTELKNRVASKVQNTKERLAYKRSTPTEDPRRYGVLCGYWSENAVLKEQIRDLQLAYAYVRGRRYWEAERFSKEAPSSHVIAMHAGVERSVIDAWLAEMPSAEEVAAYAAHVEEAKEKARIASRARAEARRSAA